MRPVLLSLLVAAGTACASSPRAPVVIGHRPGPAVAPGPEWKPPVPRREPVPEVETGSLARALDLPRGKVVVTVSCGITILHPVQFQPASTQLTPEVRATVEEVGKTIVKLQSDEVVGFELVGYADATERDPEALALARARTVAAALYARGVRDIVAVRSGPVLAPVVVDGRVDLARQRRVDFMIVRRGEKP